MAQTEIINSITRTGSYPENVTISVPYNCGTLSLVINTPFTEQQLCELPAIDVRILTGSDDIIYDFEVILETLNRNVNPIGSVEPYTIPIYDIPENCKLSITPLFDNNALDAHNETVKVGNVSIFPTTEKGIVDSNDTSSYLWTTPTQTFDVSIYFDNDNINSSGSGGGGGSQPTITVDTEVNGTSENPVMNKAIYNFVNSSIATNTANYISDNGQPFTSVSDLENYSGTVSNNDYSFVTGTDSAGNTYYDRYKATVDNQGNVTWSKEYRLNNSSFTSNQWDTINSGFTSTDYTRLQNVEAGANKTTIDTTLDQSSGNPVANSLLTRLFTPMSESAYTALTNKDLPLYFVYDDTV